MQIRYIFFLAIFLISGCRQESREVKTVDFSDRHSPELITSSESGKATLRVAVSAILSPRETFSSYEDILHYIGDELDVNVEFHQRRTYSEINSMLENGLLDFAFICSGAYVDLDPDKGVELLAVPVSHGKPYYQAYIIVPAGSPAQELSDLKDLSFAYTDLLSNTGYLYALYRLTDEGYDPGAFFSSTVFTNAHDVSIQMVARGLVDGATIDGLVFDYLQAREPDRVKDIKIIEVSEYYGIPPVVASPGMDEEIFSKVRNILFNMHEEEEGKKLIDRILIDKFIEGDDSEYDGIRKMKAAVGN